MAYQCEASRHLTHIQAARGLCHTVILVIFLLNLSRSITRIPLGIENTSEQVISALCVVILGPIP